MTDRPKCTVKGCEREAKAHGMCGLHQMRVLRTGSPNKTKRPGPKRDPFRAKVRTRALSRDWSPRTQERFIQAIKILRKLGMDTNKAIKECARNNGTLNVLKLERFAKAALWLSSEHT
jgi:hypothetical protein